MKRNFIVTTSLIDTWEVKENNYLLGKWCEFNEMDFKNNEQKNYPNNENKNINIIKNKHHWRDLNKREKDFDYVREKLEYLLEIMSEKLSIIHNIKENKEYWRVIIYMWLNEYTFSMFERWEHVRVFFEKNKEEKYYSNFILLNDSDYLPKRHEDYPKITQNVEWNHLIFLRIFNFLNTKNLSLIKKKSYLKEKKFDFNSPFQVRTSDFKMQFIMFINKLVSKFAFKFNKIIFETFYFPKKELFKICLKCKLIPCKFNNFFDFDIKENDFPKDDKRKKLKNLLDKVETKDRFILFLLSNIEKDIPKSYLENFDKIKRIVLPYAINKKVIFSMHSIWRNDNFKIYLAEAKKNGSKYIHVTHGGGLTFKMDSGFLYIEKVSDKIIRWDNDDYNQNKENFFINLSPTLPVTKIKKKNGKNCSIIFIEQKKYINKFTNSPLLDQSIDSFNQIIKFVNQLDPEIKSQVKFRCKVPAGYNAEKNFIRIFGEKCIDKVSNKNSFKNLMKKSKLIIVTYPQTAFSEAMYSNIPTILIVNKNFYLFTKKATETLDILKKNKIAFEDFEEAKSHINKNWKELELWWNNENVQSARKIFLKNFFNIEPNWYKEWSDYIYQTSISQ